LPFWLVVLRLGAPSLRELELLRFCGLRFAVEREALLRLRVDAGDFERDDPLAFVFEREPLDALLLLWPLREADLLVAIP
jgi:hypothetical protein